MLPIGMTRSKQAKQVSHSQAPQKVHRVLNSKQVDKKPLLKATRRNLHIVQVTWALIMSQLSLTSRNLELISRSHPITRLMSQPRCGIDIKETSEQVLVKESVSQESTCKESSNILPKIHESTGEGSTLSTDKVTPTWNSTSCDVWHKANSKHSSHDYIPD